MSEGESMYLLVGQQGLVKWTPSQGQFFS